MPNELICLNQAQKQSAITYLSLCASRSILIYPSSVIIVLYYVHCQCSAASKSCYTHGQRWVASWEIVSAMEGVLIPFLKVTKIPPSAYPCPTHDTHEPTIRLPIKPLVGRMGGLWGGHGWHGYFLFCHSQLLLSGVSCIVAVERCKCRCCDRHDRLEGNSCGTGD